jgi:hypothetical protein
MQDGQDLVRPLTMLAQAAELQMLGLQQQDKDELSETESSLNGLKLYASAETSGEAISNKMAAIFV